MNAKKRIALIMSLMLAAASFTGCSSTSQSPEDNPPVGSSVTSVIEAEPGQETETNGDTQSSSLTSEDWYENIPYESWLQFEQVDSPVSFFDVYDLPGDVYAIVSNGQWELDVCYLILGSDRALLFDTGLGLADIHAVVDQLTDLPVTVLLSHSHWDHIGGAYAFDDVWCYNNEACIDTITSGIPHDVFSYELEEGMIAREISADIDLETYSIRPAKVTGTVDDNDTIDLGNRTLQVVYTPGHTADSICLIDADNGLLFTGDTYYPDDLYAWCDDSDVATYADSLHKLVNEIEGIQIHWMYTGHTEVVEGTTVLLEVTADLESIVSGEMTDYVIGEEGYRYYYFPNDICIITLDEDVRVP